MRDRVTVQPSDIFPRLSRKIMYARLSTVYRDQELIRGRSPFILLTATITCSSWRVCSGVGRPVGPCRTCRIISLDEISVRFVSDRSLTFNSSVYGINGIHRKIPSWRFMIDRINWDRYACESIRSFIIILREKCNTNFALNSKWHAKSKKLFKNGPTGKRRNVRLIIFPKGDIN